MEVETNGYISYFFPVFLEATPKRSVADHNHFADDKILARRGESKQFFEFANLVFFDSFEVYNAGDLGVLYVETLLDLSKIEYHVLKSNVWVLRDIERIIGIHVAYCEIIIRECGYGVGKMLLGGIDILPVVYVAHC